MMKSELRHSASWNRIVDEMDLCFYERDKELATMLERKDIPGLRSYVEKVRARLRELFQEDFERCPLNPMTESVIETDCYKIENVLLQTMPGYYVPVNLYVPKGMAGEKFPAVLVPMGHYPIGKALRENQILCANLAAKGILAATFDPPCQGERDLFPDQQNGRESDDMWAVLEHSIPGNQAYLIGDNFQSYFIWDGMRVIDYLCSRADVDASRIGCTGQSGGGTQTQFLAALDDRITVASPIHSTTQQLLDMRKNGIGDVEQSPFGRDDHFAMDYADYIIAAFPKKIMLNVGLRDMFDIRGVRHAQSELSALYEILGYKENFAVYEDDCQHVITPGVRQNAYRWFTRWFLGKEDDSEIEVVIQKKEDLRCLIDSGRSPMDIVRERMHKTYCSEEGDRAAVCKKLGACAEEYTLDVIDGGGTESFMLGLRRAGEAFCRLRHGETGVLHIVLDFLGSGIFDCVPQEDWALELRPFGFVDTTAKTAPDYDTETNSAYASFVGGKTLFARRVSQVLTAVNFAVDQQPFDKIVIDASGQGGILALMAALYDQRISLIKARKMPASYAQFCGESSYMLEESAIVPGILRYTDIPRIAALVGIPVELRELTGPRHETLSPGEAAHVYAGARNVTIE